MSACPGISLQYPTPPEWVDYVLQDINTFLIDHAACERKAAATGMHFVVRYPDRPELIDAMIRLAREELQHFHQVCKKVLRRGLQLSCDEKDPYVNALIKLVRHGREVHLLDRLLVFGIIEARGHERFRLLAQAISDSELKDFYTKLAEAEARHHELFLEMAKVYFPEKVVLDRLDELLKKEAEIVRKLPFRYAVH